ncbi:O-succinylhomoserine sulfhydrylase [Iodobacter fluviatilis]|uniref:O-succinylhomoserine sulfhydrylase n=1 Tax=Iodobacter fluviatilis TaxID=537 RepID=A0A377Q728_9NEIS|nr:O-succinylhomoserine sulfhydrylase [Iodobacter fluviatilis]TCU88842.1 O-succinylhomoserine sulfhydrylase [Iodobacter fluviatilis]STQ91086.1 O-succinylhomoserine sulfhydrylase [Iodobacter fluviatilis]
MFEDEFLHPDTLAVRAGTTRSQFGEHSDAMYLTSSFVVGSAEEASLKFTGQMPGFIYSRFTNPTVTAFEERLAALEGAERAVATASGMSAILSLFMAHLKSGDHVVASASLFGSTIQLLNVYLSKFGVSVTYVSATDTAEWAAACQPNTKLLFLETPSNPLTEISDIRTIADIAHAHDALLVVDNCFCTPILQKPLALGADLVVHSATKYIDGQGRVLGGAVVGSSALVDPVYLFLRTAGPSLSAFNAWVLLKGLETLPIRMRAHSETALKLASYLEAHPAVEQVYYPGLPSHPQHALAMTQQNAGGGMVSFVVKGGREQAWKIVDAVQLISRTANLGDTRSTITHPASTTHGRITPAAREAAGITEGLIRISVGLEYIDDLIADLEQGLA